MMPMTGLKFRFADTPANKTRPTIDFHSIIDSHALAIRALTAVMLKQPWFNAGLLHCSRVTHNIFIKKEPRGIYIPPALLKGNYARILVFRATTNPINWLLEMMSKFSTVLILLKLASVWVNHAAVEAHPVA